MKNSTNMKSMWFLALIAGGCLWLGGCSDSGTETPTPTPNFPTAVTQTIASNGMAAISFTPNMDWTLSIDNTEESDIRSWFWFSNNGERVYTLSGKESSQAVTVHVQTVDREEFDRTPLCKVLLTMGGETRTIAQITREAAQRTFNLFISTLNEEGYFPTTGDAASFTYIYNEQAETPNDPTRSFTLLSPGGSPNNYRHRLKIEANFDWTFEAPEWLDIEITQRFDAEGKKSDTGFTGELSLTGHATNAVAKLAGAATPILFYPTGKKESGCFTYYLVFPDFSELFVVSRITQGETIRFNGNGQYFLASMGDYMDGSMIGSVTTVEGVSYYKASLVGGAYSTAEADTEWIRFTEPQWDHESDAALQDLKFSVGAAENLVADQRDGIILALPKRIASTLTTAADLFEGDQVKSDYAGYILCRLTQTRKAVAPIDGSVSIDDLELMTQNGGKIEMATDEEKEMCAEWVQTSSFYKLTTKNNEWAKWQGYELIIDPDFETFDMYYEGEKCVADGKPTDFTSEAFDCWMAVRKRTLGGKIRTNVHMDATYGGYIDEYRDGLIIFKDANGAQVAAILCVYDKTAVVGDDDGTFKLNLSSLSQHKGNIVLEQIGENDYDFDKSCAASVRQYRMVYQGGNPTLVFDGMILETANYVCQVDNTESNATFQPWIQCYFEGMLYLNVLCYTSDAGGDYLYLRDVVGADTYTTVLLFYNEAHDELVGRLVLKVELPAM